MPKPANTPVPPTLGALLTGDAQQAVAAFAPHFAEDQAAATELAAPCAAPLASGAWILDAPTLALAGVHAPQSPAFDAEPFHDPAIPRGGIDLTAHLVSVEGRKHRPWSYDIQGLRNSVEGLCRLLDAATVIQNGGEAGGPRGYDLFRVDEVEAAVAIGAKGPISIRDEIARASEGAMWRAAVAASAANDRAPYFVELGKTRGNLPRTLNSDPIKRLMEAGELDERWLRDARLFGLRWTHPQDPAASGQNWHWSAVDAETWACGNYRMAGSDEAGWTAWREDGEGRKPIICDGVIGRHDAFERCAIQAWRPFVRHTWGVPSPRAAARAARRPSP